MPTQHFWFLAKNRIIVRRSHVQAVHHGGRPCTAQLCAEGNVGLRRRQKASFTRMAEVADESCCSTSSSWSSTSLKATKART